MSRSFRLFVVFSFVVGLSHNLLLPKLVSGELYVSEVDVTVHEEDHPRICPRRALGVTNTRMVEQRSWVGLDGGSRG